MEYIDKQLDKILDGLNESIQNGESVDLDYYHSRADLKKELTKLINQARINELWSFVLELDTQDPYTPLDGTPQQYVHGKMTARIKELKEDKV